MNAFKNKFLEFKSIFVTENLLKENEQHANIVTSSTMLNLFWICLITWILVYIRVFKVDIMNMTAILLFATSLLLIPSLICYRRKGQGKGLKHILFICFTILLAFADMILKYNVTLVMILPIVLAARYYNKKFTLSIAIFTTFLFILSSIISIHFGQQDLNTYNLIIPKGTTITINNTLRDAVTELDIDENTRLKNVFIHFFLPKLLIYNIVAFACVQISQSGKKLIRKQEEITKNTQRIETELNLASAIQQNMLPPGENPFKEHNEIDIYATMIPAKEVGGDFYDMFLIDDTHLAICVADVSGKGIPGSLFMMISKILIKNVSMIDMDPEIIFKRVNNMLCDGNKTDIFVTSWFGILNLKNGKLEFANAGHNPPIYYSAKKNQFEYLKTKPNFILAGMPNMEYKKNEIQMEQGDRIFLYTDGVVESNNKENQLYGEERLLTFLNTHKELNVEDTIKGIKQDIDTFVQESPQFDDITMLELLYKNNNYDKKEFSATKDNLSNIQTFVRDFLSKKEWDSTLIDQLVLAIEEIFVNIVNYAYKDKIGTCTLTIEMIEDNKVSFTMIDEGEPFNPLEKETPNISLPVEERKIGGLGIYIMKNIMDEVSYKYQDNKNVLTMIKDKNDNKKI